MFYWLCEKLERKASQPEGKGCETPSFRILSISLILLAATVAISELISEDVFAKDDERYVRSKY